MSSTFAGFSEEDLKRIKCEKPVVYSDIDLTNAKKIEKLGAKQKRAPKLSSLKSQISDEIDFEAFDKCKLSFKSPEPSYDNNMTTDNKEDSNNVEIDTEIDDNSLQNVELRKNSTNSQPDVIRCVENYTEDELVSHKVKLEELQLRQKLMEEQNKKRKEMLAKALADRTKQTEEEVQKLEKIKKELQVLDGQFSQDVAVLRKKIDQACISFSEAEKNYLKVEKEFLQAKINLQKEREKKELLTEHLCALITHNETRKAQKLETLMLELANDKNKEIASYLTENMTSEENAAETATSTDDEREIIDGVDIKSGKIVEMRNDNK